MATKLSNLERCARTTTALRIVVAVSLAAACVMALAQAGAAAPTTLRSSEPVELDLVDVERAFWACDHAASTRGVDGPAGIACGSATEALKQRKFGGDFAAMLAWWQANKSAMHPAIGETGQDAVDTEAFPLP